MRSLVLRSNDLTFSYGEPKRTGHHLRYGPLTLGADGLDDLSLLQCALPVDEPAAQLCELPTSGHDYARGPLSGWTYRR